MIWKAWMIKQTSAYIYSKLPNVNLFGIFAKHVSFLCRGRYIINLVGILPMFYFFIFKVFYFYFFVFLGTLLWCMEVPRLGVKSELQLPATATATAMPDPSQVCDLTPYTAVPGNAGSLVDWMRQGLNSYPHGYKSGSLPLSHNGNSSLRFFILKFFFKSGPPPHRAQPLTCSQEEGDPGYPLTFLPMGPAAQVTAPVLSLAERAGGGLSAAQRGRQKGYGGSSRVGEVSSPPQGC